MKIFNTSDLELEALLSQLDSLHNCIYQQKIQRTKQIAKRLGIQKDSLIDLKYICEGPVYRTSVYGQPVYLILFQGVLLHTEHIGEKLVVKLFTILDKYLKLEILDQKLIYGVLAGTFAIYCSSAMSEWHYNINLLKFFHANKSNTGILHIKGRFNM